MQQILVEKIRLTGPMCNGVRKDCNAIAKGYTHLQRDKAAAEFHTAVNRAA